MEADQERLTFPCDHSLLRSTAMSVTEPLRHEHADLLPRLAELDTLASGVDRWQTDTPTRLRATIEFLQDHLLPHARAEEAALYPTVERVMAAPGATDTMKADHVEIVRRVDTLSTTAADIGAGPPTGTRAEQLRAELYGLSAILRLHFRKEEEVLLPVLDAQLSPDEATQLFTEMGAVAHPQREAHR
jgi:iron-sulfur cluster repair protein YtfE (RIC family)